MKTEVSTAMQNHMKQEVTTMCTCWKATLRNGNVLGFTDHTRNVTFEDVLYKSSTGYTPTAVETSSMLNVDNLEIEAILNSADIKEIDLLAGLWDAAEIENFWINYEDTSMGMVWLKSGTLGQLSLKDTSFLAEVRGLSQAYANRIGESYSVKCRATLGDARCKKDLTNFTGGGFVEEVGAGNRIFLDATRTESGPSMDFAITGISRAEKAVITAPGHNFIRGQNVSFGGIVGVLQEGAEDPDDEMQEGTGYGINGYNFIINSVSGDTFTIPLDTRLTNEDPTLGPAPSLQYSAYVSGGVAYPYGSAGFYNSGVVHWTSGLNINLSMDIKNYTVGQVELQLPMPYPIAVGDAYTIVAGCAGRFTEDCIIKFNNAINFRGEPHLPGNDSLMRVGGPPEVEEGDTSSVTAPET